MVWYVTREPWIKWQYDADDAEAHNLCHDIPPGLKMSPTQVLLWVVEWYLYLSKYFFLFVCFFGFQYSSMVSSIFVFSFRPRNFMSMHSYYTTNSPKQLIIYTEECCSSLQINNSSRLKGALSIRIWWLNVSNYAYTTICTPFTPFNSPSILFL